MRFIRVSGSPKEIGEQIGNKYKKDIHKYYEFYCLKRGNTFDRIDKTIPAYVEKHFPELMEEMEGIAKGAGMKFEEIFVYNHFNVISGCTNLFFKDTANGPILGQNLDCGKEEYEATLVREVYPEKGNSFIAVTIVGMVGVWANCINEYGLSIASVSSHHKGYLKTDGTSAAIIQRYAMQYSDNVADFYKIVQSHRYIGKIGIWMIADIQGNALRIEIDNRKYYALPVKEFGFNTGLYRTTIEAEDEPLYLRIKSERRDTIQKLYEENKIEFSLEGMKKLLSYHCTSGPICRHKPWQEIGENTYSSRIMLPRERKILVTDGPPCSNEYKEFCLKGR